MKKIDETLIKKIFERAAEELKGKKEELPKEKTLRTAIEFVIDHDPIASKLPSTAREQYIQIVYKLFKNKAI